MKIDKLKQMDAPRFKNIDEKIITWTKKELQIADDQCVANSRVIIQTPWSSVMAIHIGNETVYLKQIPARIALEATIIQLLRDQFHASVPTIIAHNVELHCFLMKDAGTSLRSILKTKFDTILLCKAIDQFTALQLTVAERVDVLLEIGVPDWRLNNLSELFSDVISKKDLLLADGLSEVEINKLTALPPKISQLCQKLSHYAIKQTLVQPDFNDNNLLIDDKSQEITIIDLGEIAISHPFFSLLNCLQQVRKHYALTEDDNDYLKIKDACLKRYMNVESRQNVLDAFEIARTLWFVYSALAHNRLIQACGKEQLPSYQPGKLSGMLKELLSSYKALA